MAMPEASMHEDYFSKPSENEVGRARQVPSVEAVSEAQSIDELTDGELWLCVLSLHPSHPLTSFRGAESVCHTEF
jgi:hypothetical protein